uniref:Bloodthirsty-related gene family, member 25 n=1 Tax=Myripristis murdjan TaxID=586833 RepID=A0A667X9K4_9TELE
MDIFPDMASAGSLLSEEQFLCPICLDVFTQPVSTPCGHNYCRDCIQGYWHSTKLPQCPMCKHKFYRRPDLKVNTFILEVASQFKRSLSALYGEVSCDVCNGKRVKALKSCLDCLASYCETHLEPHQVLGTFRKHRLIKPVMNMQDRVCKKHEKLLVSFCNTDQMYVCQICVKKDHKDHHTVPIEDESRERRAEMERIEAEVQQMIQDRLKKVTEIKNAVRAEGLVMELEQEVDQLRSRSTELEQLSHTQDHLYLLQSFPFLSTPPATKDWSDTSVESVVHVGTVRRAARRAGSQLEAMIKAEVKTLCETEFQRVQRCAVDVTLDPDTAHPKLVLSDNRKQVHHGDVALNLPDNPERFYPGISVLGKEGFSFGRFYYEVQVKGKTEWDIGVGRESVNRKGGNMLNPEGGYWTLGLRNGKDYWALTSPPIPLPLVEKPQKVGVYVDLEWGQVSFYNVETGSHIYSFTGYSFSERLFPYFNPRRNHGGVNSAPLIITPVNV